MTRFMMTLDDALDLVLYTFKGKPGDIFVQKAPAATIKVLTQAILNLFHIPEHPVNVIGTDMVRNYMKHFLVGKRGEI